MTVTAPPRPPRPSDPVEREEIEALVEALIEEARQRARRRRRRYAAVVALVALVGVAVFTVFERSAQSQTCFPCARRTVEPSRRSGDARRSPSSREPLRRAATPRRALRHERRRERQATAGAHAFGGMLPGRPTGRRSPSRPGATATSDVYVMNADGSGKRRLTRDARWDNRSGLVARRTEDRLRPGSRRR